VKKKEKGGVKKQEIFSFFRSPQKAPTALIINVKTTTEHEHA